MVSMARPLGPAATRGRRVTADLANCRDGTVAGPPGDGGTLIVVAALVGINIAALPIR